MVALPIGAVQAPHGISLKHKGSVAVRRQRIAEAVAAAERSAPPYEAWIAAGPFHGCVRVLITRPPGFERTVAFAATERPSASHAPPRAPEKATPGAKPRLKRAARTSAAKNSATAVAPRKAVGGMEAAPRRLAAGRAQGRQAAAPGDGAGGGCDRAGHHDGMAGAGRNAQGQRFLQRRIWGVSSAAVAAIIRAGGRCFIFRSELCQPAAQAVFDFGWDFHWMLLWINSSRVRSESLLSMAGLLVLDRGDQVRENCSQLIAGSPNVLAGRHFPATECRGNIAVRDFLPYRSDSCASPRRCVRVAYSIVAETERYRVTGPAVP